MGTSYLKIAPSENHVESCLQSQRRQRQLSYLPFSSSPRPSASSARPVHLFRKDKAELAIKRNTTDHARRATFGRLPYERNYSGRVFGQRATRLNLPSSELQKYRLFLRKTEASPAAQSPLRS